MGDGSVGVDACHKLWIRKFSPQDSHNGGDNQTFSSHFACVPYGRSAHTPR